MASQRVCGHEYYEATEFGGAMQFCAICDSNGAVGRCAIDHRMVCGYHSKMRDGRRICDECIAHLDAAAAAAKTAAAEEQVRAAAARAAAEVSNYLNEVRTICSELPGVSDPADRLLVLTLIDENKAKHLLPAGADSKMIMDGEAELARILTAAAKTSLPAALPFVGATPETRVGVLIRNWSDTGRLRRRTSVNLRMITYGGARGRRTVHGHIRGWQIGTGAPSVREYSGYSGGMPDRYVVTDGTIANVVFKGRDTVGEPADRQAATGGDLLGLFRVEPGTRPALTVGMSNAARSVIGYSLPSR